MESEHNPIMLKYMRHEHHDNQLEEKAALKNQKQAAMYMITIPTMLAAFGVKSEHWMHWRVLNLDNNADTDGKVKDETCEA